MGDETARKAADRQRGQLELILARIANDSLLSLYRPTLPPTAPEQKEGEYID